MFLYEGDKVSVCCATETVIVVVKYMETRSFLLVKGAKPVVVESTSGEFDACLYNFDYVCSRENLINEILWYAIGHSCR